MSNRSNLRVLVGPEIIYTNLTNKTICIYNKNDNNGMVNQITFAKLIRITQKRTICGNDKMYRQGTILVRMKRKSNWEIGKRTTRDTRYDMNGFDIFTCYK